SRWLATALDLPPNDLDRTCLRSCLHFFTGAGWLAQQPQRRIPSGSSQAAVYRYYREPYKVLTADARGSFQSVCRSLHFVPKSCKTVCTNLSFIESLPCAFW